MIFLVFLYNIYKQKYVKDVDILTEDSKRYSKFKIAKCRIDYGKARIFNSSGENILTKVIPIRLSSKNICYSNG